MINNRLIHLRNLLVCAALLSSTFFSAVLHAQSISETRLQTLGGTVTVRGIVINGPELGKIRYLQDGTGGIAAFPGTGSVAGFDGAVFPGDSIEVTGTLISFHELLEITPITSFSIISTGNPLPAPKPIALADLSKSFESQRVELECISFGNAGGTFANGGSYSVTDPQGTSAKVYLRSGHPMLGTGIPDGPIRLTAILSTYDDFQLLPCSEADFQTESCLFFPLKLTQSNLSTTGFDLQWETSLPSNCRILIGTIPNPSTVLPVSGYTTNHTYTCSNLEPGTIYWVQVEAEHDGGKILSEPVPFATRATSSGQIKTFFNHEIDHTFTNGLIPDGESKEEVLNETIARIDAAQQTIDVAVYNNNRSDITNALKAAHARGVQVRYVSALAASNTALDPAPTFPVLYGNSEAIMHNKFMIIDANLPNNAWVMSGSLNWTSQNINTDFNNTLFIQDQSLARAYEIEFEEMWGGEGSMPDELNSRFGAAKRDNTPHQFVIGGYHVESYFSPSDHTTQQIETALLSADKEALFGAFSFTKNELGNALVAVHNTGVPVRGIMENISDNGAEYTHLLTNGVSVRHHNLTGEFHHKYGVIDATDWSADPTVVTGSHNWSTAAETINDENTLILHHPVLATLFKAEFEERWGEFLTGVEMLAHPKLNVFPNPAADWLDFVDLPEELGLIQVKNTLGQIIYSENTRAQTTHRLNLSGLEAGQYFVTYISAHALTSVSFQKI